MMFELYSRVPGNCGREGDEIMNKAFKKVQFAKRPDQN